MIEWWMGFMISLGLAYAAYFKQALTKSGLIGSAGVGTVIFGGSGWPGFVVLAFFFVTSSAVSHWKNQKEEHDPVAKGERRDIVQVLANGGVAALAVLSYAWTAHEVWLVVFASSLAAATADTWASELGKFSKKSPVDCFTFQPVAPGVSGGITWLGTLSGLAGACLCAVMALPLFHDKNNLYDLLLIMIIIALSGWFGQWVDSWLGSRWQVIYECNVCGRQTERKTHCAQLTSRIKGYEWLDNDAVNLFCTLTAGITGGVTYILAAIAGLQ